MKREELSKILEDSAELFARRYLPNGTKAGDSWQCGSKDGERGSSFSMMLKTTTSARAGFWQDFATGECGGLLDLVAYYERFDLSNDAEYKKALKICLDISAKGHLIASSEPKTKQSLIPSGSVAPMNRPNGVDYWHEYRNEENTPVFYVARFEKSPGNKTFAVYSWYGADGWGKGLTIKDKRIPYRLNLLHSTGPILIVEGELKADVAASILPQEWSTLAWCGGAENVTKTDWSCLKNRQVYFWPDNDEAGVRCRNFFNEAAILQTKDVYNIVLKDSFPAKFDIKDAIEKFNMPLKDIMDIIMSAERVSKGDVISTPYEPLGFRHGNYYFVKTATFEEVTLSAGAFSKNTLMHLAPLDYWKKNFPSRKQGDDFSLSSACNHLMRECEEAGRYDPFLVRGVGVWPSNLDGHATVNTGSAVYHQGVKYTLQGAFEAGHGRFVRSKEVGDLQIAAPLGDDIAIQLSNYFKNEIIWEKPSDPYMIAGWLAIAPIASFLKFRPHIWVTAPRGAGKSNILEMIIQPLFGNYGTFIGAGSTEAAIRQELKRDATPVIYDEAENGLTRGHTRADVFTRIKAVLALARLSATATGVRIIKGSANGEVQEFSCQSAFMMMSILPSLEDTADMQRFIMVEPSRRNSANGRVLSESAKAFNQKLLKMPNLTLRFLRRQIEMLPMILKAIECFQKEFSHRQMPGRYGQLYGTVLAGLMSLETPISAMNNLPDWVPNGFYAEIVDKIGIFEQTAADYDEDETEAFVTNLLSMAVKAGAGGHEETIFNLWHNASFDEFARLTLSHYGMARHGSYLCLQKSVPNQTLKHIRELGYTEKTWQYMIRRHPAYNKNLKDKVSFNKVVVTDYYAINVNEVLPNRSTHDTTVRTTHIVERNINETGSR